VFAVGLALLLAACGSGSKTAPHTAGPVSTVTVLQGAAPDSLDPSLGYTSTAAESSWISYLGLFTYAHANGAAGTQVIPAIATGAPVVSDGGKTYTITIRRGLRYSNGTPLKASDFTVSLERALKLAWPGEGFLTGNIVGASAYAAGKSKTISGVGTDDAAGKITIHLSAPYGAFENVLAFPSLGFLPAGTSMHNLSTHPPPGFGPYEIERVVPNVSYEVDLNPSYAKQALPGIPPGHVNVHVTIQSNHSAGALAVLGNTADVFDWSVPIPGALLPQVSSRAAARYSNEPSARTEYFFLNTRTKPFNNQLAREAVVTALDRTALARLDSGNLAPGCYLLPPLLVGHPKSRCPYGGAGDAPNVAKAKALVRQSGMAGSPVTVWGEQNSPFKEFTDYYTSLLNAIGFKATTKSVADSVYFPTIGNLKLNPQTGYVGFVQDFPNPGDFYIQLDRNSITSTDNANFSQVDDRSIQSEIAKLNAVPSPQLSTVARRWQALDEYVAKKAYMAVFGYDTGPKFTSTRINFNAFVFHPVYGNDWSTLELK
jgi:peptide/nickel transport system substrate-binding protein